MGEIIIRVPQQIHREFQINDEEFVRHIVASLEAATIDSVNENENATDENSIVGIWKDREGIEDPVEFARQLRRRAWARS